MRKVGQGIVDLRDCFWYQSCCLPGRFSICSKGPWALGPGPGCPMSLRKGTD